MRRSVASAFALLILAGCQSPSVYPSLSLVTRAAATASSFPQEAPELHLPNVVGRLGESPISIKARASTLTGSARTTLEKYPELLKTFASFKPAEVERNYQSRELEKLLPNWEVETDIGDIWPIEEGLVKKLLGQLHPSAAPNMTIHGSGSYGLLRAKSEQLWDVTLRLHAQFDFGDGILVNPAQFAGRAIIDLKAQKVIYLELSVPTDNYRNVDIEATDTAGFVDLGFIETFGIEGGDRSVLNTNWTEAISPKSARRALALEYFPFERLDWQPMSNVLNVAREKEKPILAIVMEGALNDQSC